MPSFNEKDNPMRLCTDFGQLTKHGSHVHTKLEKVNDMYPLKWSGFSHSDVEKSIEKVLGPLSLFSPTSQDDEVPVIEQLQLERPVTPIDEEIKVQPQTVDQLIHYIRRRIMTKADVPFLSAEDQTNLAAIIVSEVNGIWPDVRKQIDDPFLSVQENKELYRRIAVYIVTVCEKLFQHYLQKAQVLNSRGIFSGPANTSRLKVQLALEASELLNILKIRRHIINDIKTDSQQEEETEVSPRSIPPYNLGGKLTYKAVLEDRRSRIKCNKTEMNTAENEIKEIQSRMPVLDASHLTELVACLPRKGIQSREDPQTKQSHMAHTTAHTPNMTTDAHENKIILKRCRSQPELYVGESLLDELNIEHNVKVDKLLSLELKLLVREQQRMDATTQNMQIHTGSRNFLQNDLNKLTERQQAEFLHDNTDDDLPPLVQAITRHARHDDLKQRMEKQLYELEDRQKIRADEECLLVRSPDHPQPDTVSVQLGKAGVVRTSDIRVSERVCMSSITLKRHATVYNDLLDEIDHETVKNLDTNLTLSNEIHEVYKEVMKTVPSTHMDLDDLSDQDPLVMNAPESLDITNTKSSATLFYRGPKRVINPVFIRDREPPWADCDWQQWSRTPDNPPKDIRGEDMFAPIIPDLAKINSFLRSFEQRKQTGKPSTSDEKLFHSYTSWLQWWKSTMTSDDYMKYLSIQETDFLGAVFHFYDSDDDDDDDNDDVNMNEVLPNKLQYFSRRSQLNTANKVTPEERERLAKLEELRNVKSEFKDGFWNANSVLMGGLGRDPELEEIKSSGAKGVRLKEPAIQNHFGKHRKSPDKKDRLSSMSRVATEKQKSETSAGDSQDRLESVWQRLQMPDSHRLDMAIKYSCNQYFSKLPEVIERWEATCELILQRETLLINLEKFERQASDPNRFFAKDSKNSIHRLEESRQRACLYKKIDGLDVDIKEEIEYIHSQFQDVITYRGRPYLDKMKWDRTEMLYWLAEERKQNGLKYEAITQGLTLQLRPALLQPIVPSGLLQ